MPSVLEIVTSAVAAVGLGLSIYNTVRARRDKQPKLRVHASFGWFTYGPGMGLGDEKIFFNVGNSWDQPVTLASICIPLPGKRSMGFFELEGERQMPVVLTPGTSTRFWLNSDQVEAETIKGGI